MADPTPQPIRDACGVAPSWICEKTYQATGSNTWAHLVDWVVAKPLTIALIIAAAAIINRILHHTVQRMVDRVTSNPATSNPPTGDPEAAVPPTLLSPRVWNERREARANTLGSVLRSTTSIVVWVTALFAGFGVLNINLGPLIAGAGIAGIALGFGAQSLVKDIVTGIFMLAEDQYGVGDVVDLGDAVGTVEKVSIRSTRLRDVYGVVWYVPNGQIMRVANKSQEWARALLDVTVSYDADVDAAKLVIRQTAETLVAEPEWCNEVLEPPEVWGIENFGPNGIAIRLVVKTRPTSQPLLMRELRARLKDALDDAGIPLAFEQAMRVQWRVPDPPLRPDAAGANEDPAV